MKSTKKLVHRLDIDQRIAEKSCTHIETSSYRHPTTPTVIRVSIELSVMLTCTKHVMSRNIMAVLRVFSLLFCFTARHVDIFPQIRPLTIY